MPRHIKREAVVAGRLPDVWRAWTTADGAKEFFAPKARIELRPGGPYELLFDLHKPAGQQGSEGCTVLDFEPDKRLAFSWNAPPEIPETRGTHTRVEVSFEPVDGALTRVRLVHGGFLDGDPWDRTIAYFERAWNIVLGNCAARFEDGPVDWTD